LFAVPIKKEKEVAFQLGEGFAGTRPPLTVEFGWQNPAAMVALPKQLTSEKIAGEG
jgi:hypothetical protein